MYSDKLEGAFSLYLDSEDYDQLEAKLLEIARIAFAAGWQASELESRRPKGE